jgi:hypothetical protein
MNKRSRKELLIENKKLKVVLVKLNKKFLRFNIEKFLIVDTDEGFF